jgi:predicted transcriptional regulator
MMYRTKTDIFVQILEVSKENPVTKTRIAYDCFLSYDLLSEYLNTLIECDLVKFDEGTHTYLATKRGLHYLGLCKTLGAYINAEPNNNI